jgi:hypothetical protein
MQAHQVVTGIRSTPHMPAVLAPHPDLESLTSSRAPAASRASTAPMASPLTAANRGLLSPGSIRACTPTPCFTSHSMAATELACRQRAGQVWMRI